jgi:hypothetical protein
MKLSTKAALASGARKVVAVLFSTICSAQLVDHWYDWFWVALFVLAQWAQHFEIERLVLRRRLRAARKQPINQAINVSVPESNPQIRLVVPNWTRRNGGRRTSSRVSAPTKSDEPSEPAPAPVPVPAPAPAPVVESEAAKAVRARVAAEPTPSILQRLSQIDVSSFGRIFRPGAEPEPDESDESDESDEADEESEESDGQSELLDRMRREELISAMKNLGYRSTAESIADYVIGENPDADLETLIRAALKLSRKK